MTPEQLLADLRDHTWVTLRPSSIAGVGVFAIRDIPKGCREMFSPPGAPHDFVAVPRAEIDALPAHARHLVENFCLYDAEWYWLPREGFKKLDLSHFLNHSEAPNVMSVDEGAWFEALRDIAEGEELLVDYGELVEDEGEN
ncbi:MAG: SET domain-containing protein [Gemmatimonadaceae bacterium]